MKKIYNIIFLLAGIIGFCACEDDRDSNPTLQVPTTFTLNAPAYTSGVYDLANTGSILLTTSQPDYGFTAAVIYSVQVSMEPTFSDESENYKTLSTTYSTARMNVISSEVALAMNELLGITNEEDFPDYTMPMYFRLKAALLNETAPVYSNVIELPEVLGYFTFEDPFEFIQVNGEENYFWRVRYFVGGEEAAIYPPKVETLTDYTDEKFVVIDSANANAVTNEDGSAITVNNTGWYIIALKSTIENEILTQTVEFLPPNVYLIGDVVGGVWDAKEENLFTVPENDEGDFVSPAIPADGNLRMCIQLEGQQWWHTELLIDNNVITYRGNGDDFDKREPPLEVPVKKGQKVYLNFIDGTGNVQTPE